MLPMAPTARCVEDCTAAIWAAMSAVALAVLHGERLNFGGDDGKAFAGRSRTRRLDRSIERQQIRLPGYALNELDDIVDLLRRLREAGDVFVGRLRFQRGRSHHL